MHSRTRTFRIGLVTVSLVLAVLGFASPGPCQSAEASSGAGKLTAQQQEKLEERDRYGKEASRLRSEGRLEEAIAAAEKMLAIEREVYGDVHEDVVGSLEMLARMHEQREAWDAARGARQEVMAAKTRLYGIQHWRVTDARLAVKRVERLAQLGTNERRELASVEEIDAEEYSLYQQGRYREAAALRERSQAIRGRLLGTEDPDYAIGLNNLAVLHKSMGEYAKTEPLYLQAIEIKERILGKEHPDYATSLRNLAHLYHSMGEHTKAEPLFVQAMEITKKVLGEEHPYYAASLNSVAGLYDSVGEYAKAEPLFVQALEIRKRMLGEDHPDYVSSLNNLAGVYGSLGEYSKAEPLHAQALAIGKRVLGEEHPDYAQSLNILGLLYESMGEYTKAEPLYLQARDIWKRALGGEHPDYAQSLNNLADLYHTMGDYAKAEPLYVEAMEIRKRVLGEEHPFYATSLNNLATFYESVGEYTKAEPLHLRALEIRKRVLGEQSYNHAVSLNNLASLYQSSGDNARAELLYVQAREIFKRILGEGHPSYGTSLNNLADLYHSMGDYGKAEPLYVEAMEIRKRVLGDEHPDCADSLNNLASFYQDAGDYAKADPLFRKALRIKLDFTRDSLPWLPEARAMSFLREQRTGRDPLLSVLRRLPGTAHREAYFAVWETRALVARTSMQRRQNLSGSPEAQEVYKKLRSIGQQLAQLTLTVPKPEQREWRQKRLAELNEQKEALERELSKLSVDYQRTEEVREAGVADLTRALPEATATIDIIRATLRSPPTEGQGKGEGEPHFEAFVVKPGEGEEDSVVWVHLGPAEPIEEAIAQCREAISGASDRGFGKARPLPDEPERQVEQRASPRQRLRQLIWMKLEPHLEGIQTVIIVPDRGLTRLPWAALPGRKPDTFLLEDYAIAIAENGQQLYARLTDPDISGDGLLLVGGVSYDQRPTAPTGAETLLASADSALPQRTRGPAMDDRPSWDYLAGSEQELAGVRDLWPSAAKVVLQGTSASETALRRCMPQSRYIHLATHGFFADKKFRSMFGHDVAGEQLFGSGMELVTAPRSAVTVRNPLILSGVVLAGANLSPKTDEHGLPTGEDGILTAEEVVNLDLRNTELVVLSACDTGLGKVAGGEGVFGLQRAFGLAGVRTTIASLWKVDDDATQALMVEFYRNLWEKKLGKLESLRQAQLTMLRQYDPQAKRLRGPGPVKPIDPQKLDAAKGKSREPLPPLYWAGFVLSGDWR